MRLNEEILERVEEFFDLVACDESDVELNSAMDDLRRFLERDVDGITQVGAVDLGFETQQHLAEIWDFIPQNQKEDSDLESHFNDFMSALGRIRPPAESESYEESEETWN